MSTADVMRVVLAVAALFWSVSARSQSAPGSREITFHTGAVEIPGTLVMPREVAPGGVALVVLVQGSGPNDRDETIGPNKPFRDLAEGLAAHGIATLRYSKRTWLMAHGKLAVTPADLLKVNFAVEVMDDAVAALQFAGAQPGVDPKRVFLLGHSLGGSLAPRIARERLAAQPGSVRGLIELAGAAMPANVILEYQTAFQDLLHGKPDEAMQKDVSTVDEVFRKVLDPATPPETMTTLGVPAGYLREWAQLDPAAELRALALPALVLHGGKDVQVSYADYVLLAKAAAAPGSRAQEFPALNHLMMPLAGEGSGAEYGTAAQVAPQAIDAIAGWVATFH